MKGILNMNNNIYKTVEKNALSVSAVSLLIGAVLLAVSYFMNLAGVMKTVLYAIALSVALYKIAIDSIERLLNKKPASELLTVLGILIVFLSGFYEAAAFCALAYSACVMINQYLNSQSSASFINACNCSVKYMRKTENGYETVDASALKFSDVVKIKKGDFICFDGVLSADNSKKIYSGIFNGDDTEVIVTTVYDTEIDFDAACKSEKSDFYKKYRLVALVVACLMVLSGVVIAILFKFTSASLFMLEDSMAVCGLLISLSAFSTVLSGISRAYALFYANCMKNGFIMQDISHIDSIAKIKNLIVNKNKGLLRGVLTVNEVYCVDDYNEKDVLSIALSVQPNFENPFAKAFLDKLGSKPSELMEADYFDSLGYISTISNKTITVGSSKLMEQQGIDVSVFPKVNVFVAVDSKAVGAIKLTDRMSGDVVEAMDLLKAHGIKRYAMSADNELSTKGAADMCSADGYLSLAMPADKVNYINEIKKGGFTAVVADDNRMLEVSDFAIDVNKGDVNSYVLDDKRVALAKAIIGAKSLKTFAYVRLIVAMVLLLAIVLAVVLGVIPFNSFWIAFGINCIFIVLFDILVSRFFDDNSEQDKA